MRYSYSFLNNLFGWIVFCIASLVYFLTIEPTTSFWDCGEYIATGYKLEVGHPPGAPLFLLIANFFSNFAMGDLTQIAKWVNIMSALCSSFTILFLFWTITALARKIVEKNNSLTASNLIAVLGSGVVGALAFTFTDSFWFNAVEGEVYAMSSFFTAISFWCILKWERIANKPGADRWLILIFYLMGLSVGVHLLVLLVLPAILMIYYFKKYKPSLNGFIWANIVSIIILGLIFKVVFPVVLNLSSSMELFFVNSLGLPFNTGTAFAFLLIIGLIIYGLYYTYINRKPFWNTAILSLTFLLIGYSSFVILVIRSNANTPIDENNPEEAVSLLAYLNREQYGSTPVFYGPYFNAELDRSEPFSDGNPVYLKGYVIHDKKGRKVKEFIDERKAIKYAEENNYKIDEKYIVVDERKGSIPNWDSKYVSIFPRMYSRESHHEDAYKDWSGMKAVPSNTKPPFSANIKYFVNYQLNYMYWRYFFWNFVGKQNDEQGRGEITKGNWLSGISFLDNARLGPQANMPDYLAKNPGRNTYFFLPFLLGLIGMWYHFSKKKKDAWAVFLFFLFTGIAIVVYVNQYAYQPRERDYSYVSSFYAYAIWIGLGTAALIEFVSKWNKSKITSIIVVCLCLLLVPGILAKENWDDHDRSNRYTARDFAKNYLDSCEKDAILFTNGDNDTFPLWYVQEVEGYRTDVRIVNLSLLNTDWYIDQMKRAAYDAGPVPFSLEKKQYLQGTRDQVFLQERNDIVAALNGSNGRLDVKTFVDFVASDNTVTKVSTQGGTQVDFYPTKKLIIPVNKQKVLENGTVSVEDSSKIEPYLEWNLPGKSLLKRDLMIVDLIANNNWEKPIYFAITVGSSPRSYLNLDKFFQLEGMAYRLVPIIHPESKNGELGGVKSSVMYTNLLEKYQWGNMSDPNVYLDETNRRMSYNFRSNFSRLSDKLIKEGEYDKALNALEKCLTLLPKEKFEYDYYVISLAEAYYKIGTTKGGQDSNEYKKAKDLVLELTNQFEEYLLYYSNFSDEMQNNISIEIQRGFYYFQETVNVVKKHDPVLANELYTKLTQLYQLF